MARSIKDILKIDPDTPSYEDDVSQALEDYLQTLDKPAKAKALSDITDGLRSKDLRYLPLARLIYRTGNIAIKRTLDDTKSPFHGLVNLTKRDRKVEALRSLNKIWENDESCGLPDKKWLTNTSGQVLCLYSAQCTRAFANDVGDDLREWLEDVSEKCISLAMTENTIRDLTSTIDVAIERKKLNSTQLDPTTSRQETPVESIAKPEIVAKENKANPDYSEKTKKLWTLKPRLPSKTSVLASIVITPEPEAGRFLASPLSAKTPPEFKIHVDDDVNNDAFDYDNADGESDIDFGSTASVHDEPGQAAVETEQMATRKGQLQNFDGSPDRRPKKKRRTSYGGVIPDNDDSPSEREIKERLESLDDGKRLRGSVIDSVLRAAYKPNMLLINADHLSKGGKLYQFDDITTVYVQQCYEEHWKLGVIDLKDHTIEIYNSLPGDKDDDDEFYKQLQDFAKSVTKSSDQQSAESTRWKLTATNTPRQPNTYDCGVYMLVCYLYKTHGQIPPKTINSTTWRWILRTWLGGGGATVELPCEKSIMASAGTINVEVMHAIRDSCNTAIQEYGQIWEILTKTRDQISPDEIQNLRSKYKKKLEQADAFLTNASKSIMEDLSLSEDQCQRLRDKYRFRLKQLQCYGNSRALYDKSLDSLITTIDEGLQKAQRKHAENEKLLKLKMASNSIPISRQALEQCDEDVEKVLQNLTRHRSELAIRRDEVNTLQGRINTIQGYFASADEELHQGTLSESKADTDSIQVSRQAFDQRNEEIEKVLGKLTLHDDDLRLFRDELGTLQKRIDTLLWHLSSAKEDLRRLLQRRKEMLAQYIQPTRQEDTRDGGGGGDGDGGGWKQIYEKSRVS